jgi:eukaryotic-like serine/threonine-protein kinase
VASRKDIPPDTLLGGKIRLIKRIGRGGMGDVWVARNEATQAELAVKTLHRSERTPMHDERFRREARLSATISHRNVVRVFDLVDEADGTLGLVMELLRGGTLEEALAARGPFTLNQMVAVAVPVLSAMHHVHQKGIVHRDMKPANVFFAVEPDGHVIPKVLDFGIAKLPAAGSALTIDGSVLGTPHYMSPEQIRGQEDIDGRSDMFSLAVVLYEMLTGVRVFQREQASASLAAVLEHEVDPDPRIEPRVWIAISRALAKRPYERYGSCAEFAAALRAPLGLTDDDLSQALQELRPDNVDLFSSDTPSPSGAALVTNPSRADRNGRHRVVVTASIAAAAALLGVGLTATVMRSERPSASTTTAAIDPRPAITAAPAATEPPALPSPPPAPTELDEPRAVSFDPTPAATTSPPPAPRPRPVSGGPKPPRKGVATTPGF